MRLPNTPAATKMTLRQLLGSADPLPAEELDNLFRLLVTILHKNQENTTFAEAVHLAFEVANEWKAIDSTLFERLDQTCSFATTQLCSVLPELNRTTAEQVVFLRTVQILQSCLRASQTTPVEPDHNARNKRRGNS